MPDRFSDGPRLSTNDPSPQNPQAPLMAEAFDAHPDPQLTVDLNGRILAVNRALEKLSGRSATSLVDQPVISLWMPGARTTRPPAPASCQTSEPWEGPCSLRSAGDVPLICQTTQLPIRSARGTHLGALLILHPELSGRTAPPQAQDHLMALNSILLGTAHDFNNLLSVIIGNAEISLVNELPEQHPATHSLRRIVSAAEQARALSEPLPALTRCADTPAIAFSLTPLIKGMLKTLRSSVSSPLTLSLDLQASPDRVLLSPARLFRLLMDLCGWISLRLTASGGHLQLGPSDAPPSSGFARRGKGASSHILLTLTARPTQPASPPEPPMTPARPEPLPAHPHLTSEAQLIHMLVALQEDAQPLPARLEAFHDDEGGSVLTLWLPRAATHSSQPPSGHSAAPATQPYHIMLIDDEPEVLHIACRLLENLGYAATGCQSSHYALELFQAAPESFDLVITDITMPGLQGEALARQLLALRPDLPVLYCTGHLNALSTEELERQGIRGMVFKPLLRRELQQILKRLLPERAH